MSSAPTMVVAAPAPYSGAAGPSSAVEEPPEDSGPAGQIQSFTAVLSQQRATPEGDAAGDRDVHGQRDAPSGSDHPHGERARPAQGERSVAASGAPAVAGSSSVVDQPVVTPASVVGLPSDAAGDAPPDSGTENQVTDGALVTVAPDSGTSPPTESAVAVPPPSGGLPSVTSAFSGVEPPGESSHAEDSGVASADTPTPVGAEPSGKDGVVALAPARTVPASLALVPGHAPQRQSSGSDSSPPAMHGESDVVADRAATVRSQSTAVEPASSSTPPPAPHAQNDGPLALSVSSHPGPALKAGESAAPSSASPSVVEQASGNLDVDGLSGSISRPLGDGNGNYTVTVAMHPPELGHVQAVMSLDGNDLQVSITAQTQRGHEALSNSVDALKNQLGRGGVNVNVSLRDPGSNAGGDDTRRPAASASKANIVQDPETVSPLALPLTAGQIHLVL